MSNVYLYHLSNADTLSVFYVGITKFPKSRYIQHSTSSKNKSILAGSKLIMTIFAEIEETENPRAAEKYIILKSFQLGIELINETLFSCGDYKCDAILSDFVYSVNNISKLKTIDAFKFIPTINESCLLLEGKRQIKVQVILSEYEDELLKQEAYIQGVSVSSLVRRYILEGLSQDELKEKEGVEI